MAQLSSFLLQAWRPPVLYGHIIEESSSDSTLSQILHSLSTPALQHLIVSVVQLVCLVGVGILAVIRLLSKRLNRNSQSRLHEDNGLLTKKVRITPLFTITLCLVGIVDILYIAFLLWRIQIGISHGWETVPVHEVAFFVSQALTWMAFSAIIGHEKRFKSPKHTPILRLWWITNFILTFLTFCTSIAYFASHNTHYSLAWFDSLLNIATFPVAAFLLVLGLVGTTGIQLQESNALKESLLQVPSENHHSLDIEEVTGFHEAGIFNKLTFNWLNPLLKRGIQKPLEAKDVPHLAPGDKAETVYMKLMANYCSQQGQKSLLSALFMSFWPQLAFTAFLALAKVCVVYVGPILISEFVNYVSGKQKFPLEGLALVAILLLAKSVEVLSSHHYNFFSNKLGMVVRSALITTIYRKGLVLSSFGRQLHGTGQIVNYMSVDVQQISDSIIQIHNTWSVPVYAVVAIIVLLSAIGISCFVGVVLIIIFMTLSFALANAQKSCQGNIMQFRDKRTAAITEVLNSMKIIKMQYWEDIFQAKVEQVRSSECHWLAVFIYCLSVNIFMLWLIPVAVSAATFTFCIILGKTLTPGNVFTTISTFRILQEPLRVFPQTLMSISQSLNSLDRIQKFMLSDELDETAVERLPCVTGFAVQVEDGTFSWTTDTDRKTLRGINISVAPGTLVCIVGQVGSGKSTLLASLLGEVPKLVGKVRLCGRTAYVGMPAWIQNATIEQNIRFGRPMDPVKYHEAIRVCSLREDLVQMPFGDQTEIGERGLNLSGGQKQRIQLARAVYQDADVYLLDDVFSAVDAHTGSALFKECIKGVLSNKTVLLVTHQVDFLHGADQIWVMRDGEIVQSGLYNDLVQAGLDFGDLIAAHKETLELVESEFHPSKTEQVLLDVQEFSRAPLNFVRENSFGKKLSPKRKSGSGTLLRSNSNSKSFKKLTAKLIEEEERETGKVNWQVYWIYLTKTMKGFHVIVILFFQMCWQGLQISSDYFLSYSTAQSAHKFNPRHFISVYVGLAFGSTAFVLLRTLLVSYSGIRTCQSLFLTYLNSIMHAPMSFFDTTPTGRILTRFATDQSNVDVLIPIFMSVTLAVSFQSLGILIVVIQVTWYLIFIVVPLAWVYFRYQRYFMATSRELTRLDSITKAPIIHHFSETVAGFITIRAFQEQERFKLENINRVDSNLRMDFHNNAANEWLGFRLELIGTTILCASALLIVTVGRDFIPSNLVGLSLSYGLALNTCLYVLIYISCQLENKMVSVERINQYSNIASEAPAIIEGCRPPQNWPQKGNIELQELQLRYRPDTPLVLKGISISIRGGDKVGVVGRTGSGKSTLILGLLRLVEPAGGCIYIDGLNISTIGLKDLRTKFGVIPQDPTLFEGTVRSNIDPVGVHGDDEIWGVLEKCTLANSVKEQERGLESAVEDNGENWSMGQRQLFCLGRALLNKSRILLLDEATASVDTQTDAIMQKTIRQEFHDCTVISIAHRIGTVMDSDTVLVLDSGHVKEFDSPSRLLEDSNSLFSTLVREYTTRTRSYEAEDHKLETKRVFF